jgi:hypothetical protein
VCVTVASGVSVAARVALAAGTVEVGCCVEGAQAEIKIKTKKMTLQNFI